MKHDVRILPSNKFYHARRQWRVEAGGHTLLRLTYGQTGGALKTATVSDDWRRPPFEDYERLFEAMATAVEKYLSPNIQLIREADRQGREFLEFSETGRLEDFFSAAELLAADMAEQLATCPRALRLRRPVIESGAMIEAI